MADFTGILEPKELQHASRNFKYLDAIKEFKGTALFPLEKSENIKLSITMMDTDAKIPVMAQVHGLDTEARIGDRPNPKSLEFEQLYVKEKLNQGERLTKMLKEMGLQNNKDSIIKAIFNDAENLISRVLTRGEAMVCEMLGTGKITVNENNVSTVVDYELDPKNKKTFNKWSDKTHNILGDITQLKNISNSSITKMITSTKVLGYILANEQIAKYASDAGVYATDIWLQDFFKRTFRITIDTFDHTYKESALGTKINRFYPVDAVTFLSEGVIGKTFTNTSPLEDFNSTKSMFGHVGVDQWKDNDPKAVWTLAGAIFLPIPYDINDIYIGKVS